MTIWNKYEQSQREEYIQFLQVYGALTNLFRQKKGDMIPYLDSKFQETVYAKAFNSKNVDIGNTPHDILSIFKGERVGIGLKTWMNSTPSYQKVMQLKSFKQEIEPFIKEGSEEELAYKLATIKNNKLLSDYERLGLSEDKNIYHYVTRDRGKFVVQETTYPLVEVNSLKDFNLTPTSFSWNDGLKEYKFTYGDSQIWQKFSTDYKDTSIITQFDINIIEDPFEFLLKAYMDMIGGFKEERIEVEEVYLPLYSFESKEVEKKSGLNAWNAAPKSTINPKPRPLNEVYIPIPRAFHKKYPNFFTSNIFEVERQQKAYQGESSKKPQVRFHLELPNGKRIPSLVTQANMKGLQSGSNTEKKADGTGYGQADLGQWLLVDVLGLKDRTVVTREWLKQKGTDSVKLWRNKDDYSTIYIDFAPYGSFEKFMKGEGVSEENLEE